ARAGLRQGLKELCGSAQATPEYQARVGWLVDPDDRPAFRREGIDSPPNPELPVRREVERGALRGLADDRYRADAAEVRKLDLQYAPEGHKKAVQQYAAGLDAIRGG